jgi:AraC family transcriptional regulator
LAKIAVEVAEALARRSLNGAPGRVAVRPLAQGEGWRAQDLICTSGPRDRPFEERHASISIAIVAAGSFRYRSSKGRELMTPGSLLLGNVGECFECGHEHGEGDRCLVFHYAPEYFERLASDAGAPAARSAFSRHRLPPLRALSPLVARALAGVAGAVEVPWEELAVQLAVQTVELVEGLSPRIDHAPSSEARVAKTVRGIERHPEARLTLGDLAREAGLSPFHFLRTFEKLTGLTPHQYVLRARLREAAVRLVAEPEKKILDIALDCGFGDLSNFNRAFRAELGVSPRAYRLRS